MQLFNKFLKIAGLVLLFLPGFSQAQSFFNGDIAVLLNDYGRIRLFSDSLTTRQIDRSSILVGVSTSAVFDYQEDAENLVPPASVTSPQFSDYEITVSIDNTWSNLPPDVVVEEHIFGWNSGGYAVGKLIVTNNETTAINAVIGLEIIPQIDGLYGFENVLYDSASQVVMMNTTSYVGYKFFSDALTSLRSFDWFSGYGNDADYYTWLTQNSFDPPLTGGVDGVVVIMGQSPVNLNPGVSYNFYFGLAIGSDQTTMMDNMVFAEDQYLNSIIPVELVSFTALTGVDIITLNWETASELNNHGFEIERKLIRENKEHDWITIGFVEGRGTTTESTNYSYTDYISGVSATNLQYRLKQVDFNGQYSYSDFVEVSLVPVSVDLYQNYPNPFNPETNISFTLMEKDFVTLKVFNSLGQQVATLVNSELDAGIHLIAFDASNLTSGAYFYTLRTKAGMISKKMTLVK